MIYKIKINPQYQLTIQYHCKLHLTVYFSYLIYMRFIFILCFFLFVYLYF